MGNGRGKEMTCGSLFACIGGLDLGFKWAGIKCIWQSEIVEYRSALLTKRFGVPNLGDIEKINWEEVERPDLLCGGFPCQDISQAGNRAGIDGAKSRLWYAFRDAIRRLEPENILVENVSALLVRGMGVVLRDLANLRYNAEWGVLSSAGVGKNHQRKRVFIYAYPNSGNAAKERFTMGRGGRLSSSFNAVEPYVVSRDQTAQEPGIHRVANGLPNQLDRLTGLGNAVDPHVAYRLGKAIVRANKLFS